MKIYTEINYIWSEEKGQLIETSSKSYDYEGPMTLLMDTNLTKKRRGQLHQNRLQQQNLHSRQEKMLQKRLF